MLSFVLVSVAAGGGRAAPERGVQELNKESVREWKTIPLASSALRELVGEAERGGTVRVEVAHDLRAEEVRRALDAVGATRVRPAGGDLVEAFVPVDRLVDLERTAGIRFLRPPLITSSPTEPASGALSAARVGEQVGKTNAGTWHIAGHRGLGVKVGIIDRWGQAQLNSAVTAGEVPTPAGTFCMNRGVACDPAGQQEASRHGVAVAEVIHEMAPGAQLYLARTGASSSADLLAAVNYFASQGVRVVSRSETGEFDGPGNGTGATASVVDQAVGRGMVWVNSAGNSGGSAASAGSYWRGSWYDPDLDGWLNFSGNDELLDIQCGFLNGLRWSDWGAARTDYDAFVFDDPAAAVEKIRSEDNQPAGAPPLEHLNAKPNASYRCGNSPDIDYLAVKLYAVGGGTQGDILEFMTNGTDVQYWSNSYSVTQPAADSASPGALSVGAVDPPLGAAIAPYSAQGPTNDGRLKPDLAAASCVQSFIYSPGCFDGTSAATPVVSGASALVLGAWPTWTAAQVKSYLLQSTVDRGQTGPDYVFGVGELVLPAIVDRILPKARAFAARGRYGRRVRLRYSVSDNSGQTRERVDVYRGGRRVKRTTTGFSKAGTYFVSWRAPGSGRGFRFCVRAFDARGNASRVSCARIRLR